MKNLLFTIFAIFLFCGDILSQIDGQTTSDWKFLGSVQYVTQHYWRGLGRGPLFGDAPAFEPSIAFSNLHWNIGVFAGGHF